MLTILTWLSTVRHEKNIRDISASLMGVKTGDQMRLTGKVYSDKEHRARGSKQSNGM